MKCINPRRSRVTQSSMHFFLQWTRRWGNFWGAGLIRYLYCIFWVTRRRNLSIGCVINERRRKIFIFWKKVFVDVHCVKGISNKKSLEARKERGKEINICTWKKMDKRRRGSKRLLELERFQQTTRIIQCVTNNKVQGNNNVSCKKKSKKKKICTKWKMVEGHKKSWKCLVGLQYRLFPYLKVFVKTIHHMYIYRKYTCI